jgi:hypothetical protein
MFVLEDRKCVGGRRDSASLDGLAGRVLRGSSNEVKTACTDLVR